jgi:hypothetical protein
MNAAPGDKRFQTLTESLGVPARRLDRRRLHAVLVSGLRKGLMLVSALAAAYLMIRLVQWALGRPLISPMGPVVYAGLAAMALLVPLASALSWWRRHRATVRQAAERVDEVSGNHNRLSTGLELAQQGGLSVFASAAVDDAVEWVKRCPPPPTLFASDAWSRLRREVLPLLVAAVALNLLAGWLPTPPGPAVVGGGGTQDNAAGDAQLARLAASADEPRDEPTDASAPDRRPARHERSGPAGTTRDGQGQAPAQRSAGQASGGSQARGKTVAQSASSQGQASNAKTSSSSEQSGKPKQGKNPSSRRPRMREAAARQEESDSSSSSAGNSSTGGSMLAVSNPWSQKARSTPGDPDAPTDDDEEPVEDDPEQSRQRGGVQPSLKDRNEAPSRELGISEGDGPPGSGRGGPTPPKKSRGTASMVLGVPVPDFVKGRMGPGTTKITHQRVEPSAMPGAVSPAAPAATRTADEHPRERYDIPPGLARLVQRYLIALHTQDRAGPPPGGIDDSRTGRP